MVRFVPGFSVGHMEQTSSAHLSLLGLLINTSKSFCYWLQDRDNLLEAAGVCISWIPVRGRVRPLDQHWKPEGARRKVVTGAMFC